MNNIFLYFIKPGVLISSQSMRAVAARGVNCLRRSVARFLQTSKHLISKR